LRQALSFQLDDLRNPNALPQRKEQLTKLVARLRTLGQLRRALSLPEWKDDSVVPELRNIDRALRAEVGRRLVRGVRAVIAGNAPTAVRAVADMLGDMGTGVRSLDPEDRRGFTRTLTPELVKLVTNPALDDAARQAAARALGKINPDPDVAAPALKTLLQRGTTVGQRRAAVDGLGNLVRTVNQLQRRGKTQTGVETSREEV